MTENTEAKVEEIPGLDNIEVHLHKFKSVSPKKIKTVSVIKNILVSSLFLTPWVFASVFLTRLSMIGELDSSDAFTVFTILVPVTTLLCIIGIVNSFKNGIKGKKIMHEREILESTKRLEYGHIEQVETLIDYNKIVRVLFIRLNSGDVVQSGKLIFGDGDMESEQCLGIDNGEEYAPREEYGDHVTEMCIQTDGTNNMLINKGVRVYMSNQTLANIVELQCNGEVVKIYNE